MTRHKRSTRYFRGFTLIEAVSTIAILGAIGAVASNIMLTATDSYIAASTGAQLQTELSIALDRAVRELRSIQLDDGATGIAPDIDSVTATAVNWDDDNDLTLTGTNLVLTIDGTSGVLLSDVSAFDVSTFDEDNSALGATLSGTQCDDIRRVELTMTQTRAGVSATLRTRIFVRSTLMRAGTGS